MSTTLQQERYQHHSAFSAVIFSIACLFFADPYPVLGQEVDYRCSSSWGRGGYEHIAIKNKDGASLLFSCNTEFEAGLFFERAGLRLIGLHTFQFEVDEKNYPLDLKDGALMFGPPAQMDMASSRRKSGLDDLVLALLRSKSRYFFVEIPDLNTAFRFSLLNVQDAFGEVAKSKRFCSS